MATVRLTVAQAVVRFLANQYSERDGVERRLITGAFGIFGHGNVAGVGQALLQAATTGEADLPYYLARNEQGMVHAATGYARTLNRLQAMACTASIGPGSTNMLTGAAVATTNRQPVLLLPSDIFATRVGSPVLQELEHPTGYDIQASDAFRPLSRFFERVWRPEMLPRALLGAMRVLTDQAETGAVTIALPQDVQAEAFDWPEELFAKRVWHITRPAPDPAAVARAVEVLRSARKPLIVAGGGLLYSEATEQLRRFADATGIPVADTQAGKGSILWEHAQAVGGVGSTGSPVANALARDADVVLGIGTRYSDFTTASKTAFQNPDVRFVNLNVASLDAVKLSAVPLVADARLGLEALTAGLDGHRVDDAYVQGYTEHKDRWNGVVDEAFHLDHQPLPAQTEILGALNELVGPDAVVVQAAGSMPGDLQMLWRAQDPKQYHVEYAFSCMGYEVAGALGRQDGRPGARGVRAGRRRLVPDDGPGDRHRGVRGHQAGAGDRAEPRVLLDRLAVREPRLAAVRHVLPLPQHRVRACSTGTSCPSTWPRTPRASAPRSSGCKGMDEFREAVERVKSIPHTVAIHIESDPLAPGAVQRELVGRPRLPGVRPRQHPGRLQDLRGPQGPPASLPDPFGGNRPMTAVTTASTTRLPPRAWPS